MTGLCYFTKLLQAFLVSLQSAPPIFVSTQHPGRGGRSKRRGVRSGMFCTERDVVTEMMLNDSVLRA